MVQVFHFSKILIYYDKMRDSDNFLVGGGGRGREGGRGGGATFSHVQLLFTETKTNLEHIIERHKWTKS